MNVLGVHYGHNATLCLMQGGTVTFCQSEERFNRIKNTVGFPVMTLEYLYKNIIKPEDIDLVVLYQASVFGYNYLKERKFESHAYLDYVSNTYKKSLREKFYSTVLGDKILNLRYQQVERNKKLREESDNYFSQVLQIPKEKIRSIDHHASHAYSALPNIKEWNESSLVFTLDGEGDNKCASVYVCKDGKLEVLSETHRRHSLGFYYSFTTALLGMKPSEHEFKVMGMAPYAKRRYYKPILDKLLSMIKIDKKGNWKSTSTLTGIFSDLDDVYRYQRFDNICGAIQELTEIRTTEWIQYWIKKTGIHNISLTGGVFMNVKACQKIVNLPEVNKVFVVPSAADESCAIGCCAWGTQEVFGNEIKPLNDLYMGVEYDDASIEEVFQEMDIAARYEVSIPVNINKEVAKLLADNKIVARCSGPMEFGARALGNRSILANPSSFQNLQKINDAIKNRDFWMPFTPSILDTDIPRYIKNHEKLFAPYMCITFDGTDEAKRDLPAAIHPRDCTVRPQCVKEDWNSNYYEIIKTFKSLTGIGAILNTSFNLHGEPNVCTPLDAIRTVDNSGLEYLAMGKYLLKKK